jgi:PhnB protein
MDRNLRAARRLFGERVTLVFTPHRISNITKECSMQVNPYLTFNGNCEEAFETYQGILGGDIVAMIPHEGTPAEGHVPAQWLKKILHARLVGNGMVLMGSDAPPERYQPMQGFSVNLSFKSPEEAERVFNALADKGTVRMALSETFWAKKFGMLTDKFGTPWMINCEKAQ